MMKDNDNVRKRKRRPITSCQECYRRKQKCDREQPCSICTIRGIPEHCTFDATLLDTGSSSSERIRDASTLAPKNVLDSDLAEDILIASASFGEQTGYSSTNGNNLSILQKSLRSDEDITSAGTRAAHARIPDFVTYQLLNIKKTYPSREIQAQLIDLYFSQCWWWFSSLEPTNFRQRFERWHSVPAAADDETLDEESQRESHYFAAVLFQVLAIALQYLPPDMNDIRDLLRLRGKNATDLLSIRYSKAGMQIVDLLGRYSPTTTVVQHDMLRGIWLKNFSRGTESWYSLGHAIRQAQELGLHQKQDPPDSLRGERLNQWLWNDVLSQRIWACLFSWDAHVAFTLGRPRIINSKDCTRMKLVACDVPGDTSLAPPPTHVDNAHPCLITSIIFHYSMAHLVHEMLDVGADKPRFKEYSIVDQLHNQMDALLDELPQFFRVDDPDTSYDAIQPNVLIVRVHLKSLAHTYLVALHRAHVLRRTASCEAAVGAALRTLDAQAGLFNVTPQHKWRIYTYSFYTIDSAIFLAALLLERPSTLREGWYDKVSKALSTALGQLDQMKEVSLMAKTGVQLLGKCYERVQTLSPLSTRTLSGGATTTGSDPGTASSYSVPSDISDHVSSDSFKSWIEQMDQVMLPILEANADAPFDDALWEALLEG